MLISIPRNFLIIPGLLLVLLAPVSLASDDHIAPEEYLQNVFGNQQPDTGTVWLTGEKQEVATQLLGHKPDYLRLRYWRVAERSVWIVDEIGKTEPITIGVTVADNSIEDIEVLAFRESRGWEIKHDFFTRQFAGVSLDQDRRLDNHIDGITGATLSVRAMNNVSRLVLYLSQFLDS